MLSQGDLRPEGSEGPEQNEHPKSHRRLRVIPAIDLLGGQAVRLREGRRDEATVYDAEPWAVAER